MPGAREAEAAKVSVLLPEPGEAIVVGANVAVKPDGSPLARKATEVLNEALPVVVSVTVVLAAGATVAELADALSVNDGGGRTVSVSVR